MDYEEPNAFSEELIEHFEKTAPEVIARYMENQGETSSTLYRKKTGEFYVLSQDDEGDNTYEYSKEEALLWLEERGFLNNEAYREKIQKNFYNEPIQKQYTMESKEKTLTENLHLFQQYVVDKANTQDKTEIQKIYEGYFSKITSPAMKSLMDDYHQKISKAGILTNKDKILSSTLSEMHLMVLKVTAGEGFAEARKNDPSFKMTMEQEAKNLHSGSRIFSLEVAAYESKVLREELERKVQQVAILKEDNTRLQGISKAYTNLVSNVKNMLGVKPETITEFSNKHFNELSANVKEEDLKNLQSIGYFNKLTYNNEGDYPEGVSEKQKEQTIVFGKTADLFIVKRTVEFYEPDGFIDTLKPTFEVMNKAAVEKLINDFKQESPEKNRMAAHSLSHNLNSFITGLEKESLKVTRSIRH